MQVVYIAFVLFCRCRLCFEHSLSIRPNKTNSQPHIIIIMANLDNEVSISTATTSEHYFPVLSTQCSELRLQILKARTGRNVRTDRTRKQRPRLQLIFPDWYTPPGAMAGDEPCDGIILTLNPRGGSGDAKCKVKLSKSASSSTSDIVSNVSIPYLGTVRNLLDVARDTFGTGHEKFKYSLSHQRLHSGRDF
ncbi:hypothetical protein GGR57DRAFT_452159 [Xylariaceae sp. FL1272]|nr:hypothetical protein GGR57DRAFT_452159 [Xylariaceae sp. FL1272]